MNDPFGSKIINLRVAYMDVGEGREHDYREVGGRMKSEPESRSGSFAKRKQRYRVLALAHYLRPCRQ